MLPGTVQAWHEAPIYARTNGYLKEWETDIGTKVKEGDLLAEIETPEIDSQLRQAEADLKTAEANGVLAQSTAERWKDLLKTDSVSKQEADEKIGDAAAKAAALASAQRQPRPSAGSEIVQARGGAVRRHHHRAQYRYRRAHQCRQRHRPTGVELFHIADIPSKLRVYVQVPQNDAGAITPDLTADLHFTEHPGKVYPAKLASKAPMRSIRPTARC